MGSERRELKRHLAQRKADATMFVGLLNVEEDLQALERAVDEERADGADADLEVVPRRREHQRVSKALRDGEDRLRDDVAN